MCEALLTCRGSYQPSQLILVKTPISFLNTYLKLLFYPNAQKNLQILIVKHQTLSLKNGENTIVKNACQAMKPLLLASGLLK